jgi:membrane dipeptidase
VVDINRLSIVLILLLAGCAEQSPEDIAQSSLIVDTHIDTPYRIKAQLDNSGTYEDIAENTSYDFDYPRALSGGLNVPFFSIYLPADTEAAGTSFNLANELIDLMNSIIEANPEKFFLIDTSTYLGNLPGQNLIGIAYGMENGAALEGNLSNVEYFYKRGIRYITLTHSKSNHISDSSYDENKQWGGLSEFGKNLITEMNNVGIIIDISHVSDAAFLQAIDISNTPVIASHSSLRHFTPGWERNVSDSMLEALANKGGVLQINFGTAFLTDVNDKSNSYDPSTYIHAGVTDVVDHIDRVVALVGVEHVGIGSDYDGVGDTLPNGLKDVSTYPNLIAELQNRGYSTNDIQKILGGNFARVWREVEEYARNN